MEEITRIAVSIVVRHNQVLLVQRTVREGDLNWQFPAGRLEEGEKPFNTAERETFEETGVRCKAVLLLGFRKNPANGAHIHYVVCDFVSGKEYLKDTRENKAVSWVNIQDIRSYIPNNLFEKIAEYFNI